MAARHRKGVTAGQFLQLINHKPGNVGSSCFSIRHRKSIRGDVFLDFEGTFDPVDRSIFLNTLAHQGMPRKFMNIVRSLYSDFRNLSNKSWFYGSEASVLDTDAMLSMMMGKAYVKEALFIQYRVLGSMVNDLVVGMVVRDLSLAIRVQGLSTKTDTAVRQAFHSATGYVCLTSTNKQKCVKACPLAPKADILATFNFRTLSEAGQQAAVADPTPVFRLLTGTLRHRENGEDDF
ncbi:hypothetical protein CLF_101449 [Clonorchis sinensis]|uniref:Uncharacterized protein n=1 Tax=Clonorchis sinensis TaxID=79923 RepID=G7Y5S5_CLOSI|nr:hypothetical protein CLF_101449 [Clonorchis sinensis]